MNLDRLAPLWQTSRAYLEYVGAQAQKTQKCRMLAPSRQRELVQMLVRVPADKPKRAALSVGCRNSHELDLLLVAGFDPVTGIDLSSADARVLPIDMHQTPFPSRAFDVIFSCHSLEHAYDVDVVFDEWIRLSHPGTLWAIEIPINYEPTAVDRHDFQSVDGLIEAIHERTPHVPLLTYENDEKTAARLITRL